jgi:hypothetical protein
MAHVRIARKDFVKCLGAVAAACVARPAVAATAAMKVSSKAQEVKPVTLDLPMKARPAARIVALRGPMV